MVNQAEQLSFWPDMYPPKVPSDGSQISRWGEVNAMFTPPHGIIWTSRPGGTETRRAHCNDMRTDEWFLFLDTAQESKAVCRHPNFNTVYCVGIDAARKWVAEGSLPKGFLL